MGEFDSGSSGGLQSASTVATGCVISLDCKIQSTPEARRRVSERVQKAMRDHFDQSKPPTKLVKKYFILLPAGKSIAYDTADEAHKIADPQGWPVVLAEEELVTCPLCNGSGQVDKSKSKP